MATLKSNLLEAVEGNKLNDLQRLVSSGEDINTRNSEGQTLLHCAVKCKASLAVLKFLLDKIDLGVRDLAGNNVADLIFTEDLPEEIETEFTNFIKGQILQGKIDMLEKLVLSGWTFWPITKEQANNVSEELRDFICKLSDFQEKVSKLHKAIQQENLRDVKNILDRKKFILAADRSGLPPFQKAVLFGNIDVVEWLAQEFKFAVENKDNMGRTPLHYAAGIPDAGHIYQILCDAGANEEVVDLTGKTPKDYYANALLLGVVEMREKVEAIMEAPIPQPKHTTEKMPQMYISSETRTKRVPPPTTVDGRYAAEHLGNALTLALAEIAEKRPWDPIEYLGQWLYKFKENKDFVERQEILRNEIQQEEEAKLKQQKINERMKQEQQEIQEKERQEREKEEEEKRKKEQEELQRKARESDALAQPPSLDTVTEEGEEDPSSKDKDGQTELHKLAAQEGADLMALVNLGYDLADRDGNNKTPRDIAVEKDIKENVEIIDNYIKGLIEKEKISQLEQLLLNGYDQLQPVIDKLSSENQSESIKKFIEESVPELQEKMKSIAKVIQRIDSPEEVKQILEKKELAMARDSVGRSPLHIAVLMQQLETVEFIASTFPDTLKNKDNLNRTPLHYAMGLQNEDIINTLTGKGADDKCKDAKQRTPSFYKDNSAEIEALRDQLSQSQSLEPAQTTEQQEASQSSGQQEVTQSSQQEVTPSSQEEVAQSSEQQESTQTSEQQALTQSSVQ